MKLTEGLDYHDMKGQVDPKITVDEYSAKMGDDSDIVTLTFKTNSKLAAQDLVSWFELGYDYILDASVSDGEIEPGKWLVFAEMKRRTNVPHKIVSLLKDLETLTDLDVKEYTVTVDDKDYDATVDELKDAIILTPIAYIREKGEDHPEEDTEQPPAEEPPAAPPAPPTAPAAPAAEPPAAPPAPAAAPAAPAEEPLAEQNAELNKMRNLAGLAHKQQYNIDEEIRKYIANAGL